MTKKDYIVIAEVFKKARHNAISRYDDNTIQDIDLVEKIARELCGVLWRDNSRFDSSRFLKACGIVEP